MENQELNHAFDRYLNGQANAEEVKQLLIFFHLEKEGEILTERVMQEMAQHVLTDEATREQRKPMYQRVQVALRERISVEQQPRIIPMWRKQFYRIAGAAAIIFFIAGLSIWMLQSKPNLVVVNVPYGQIKEVTLPDNSKVVINSGTTITYPEKFDKTARTVTLKNGDAFFDVVHDIHHPFIVKTKDGNVTVMGTSFEVRAYEKDREDKIDVSTGKVGVLLTGSSQPATFVEQGERVVFNRLSHTIRKTTIPVSDIAVWREKKLIFDDQPLDEVLQSLERKYNVRIEIKNDRLLAEKVSMRLNNQPLNNVLSALSFSKHFNYEIINDQLVVVK